MERFEKICNDFLNTYTKTKVKTMVEKELSLIERIQQLENKLNATTEVKKVLSSDVKGLREACIQYIVLLITLSTTLGYNVWIDPQGWFTAFFIYAAILVPTVFGGYLKKILTEDKIKEQTASQVIITERDRRISDLEAQLLAEKMRYIKDYSP